MKLSEIPVLTEQLRKIFPEIELDINITAGRAVEDFAISATLMYGFRGGKWQKVIKELRRKETPHVDTPSSYEPSTCFHAVKDLCLPDVATTIYNSLQGDMGRRFATWEHLKKKYKLKF